MHNRPPYTLFNIILYRILQFYSHFPFFFPNCTFSSAYWLSNIYNRKLLRLWISYHKVCLFKVVLKFILNLEKTLCTKQLDTGFTCKYVYTAKSQIKKLM